jgi:hypothetical protein
MMMMIIIIIIIIIMVVYFNLTKKLTAVNIPVSNLVTIPKQGHETLASHARGNLWLLYPAGAVRVVNSEGNVGRAFLGMHAVNGRLLTIFRLRLIEANRS